MARMAWLFLRDAESLRVEREAAGNVIRVFGPGAVQERHEFSAEAGLLEFQSALEERLLGEGWVLQAYHERRSGGERRSAPRGSGDRRRGTH